MGSYDEFIKQEQKHEAQTEELIKKQLLRDIAEQLKRIADILEDVLK